MRAYPCTFILAMLLCIASFTTRANSGTPANSDPPESELDYDIIKLRLGMMDCSVKAEFNNDVAAYLRRFLTYGYQDTERMLGEGKIYFPIFEHYLELHGLPKSLKYLPMIESSLVPYSVSYVGAAGLWQFMPSTGKYMGLIIDKYMDERKDPYKSTEAAVKYLKKLHKKFGTWELALAAYNCGPSRLTRTIQAYDSNDYWKIKSGLPKETQKYISRYIAACYTGTFHNLHGIYPSVPEFFHLEPMAARLYSPVSLKSISSITGVDLETLRRLNPSFKMDYTPARTNGIFLVLPRSSWYDYLDAKNKGIDKLAARP
ncbi:MAG: lytic transglycosylase domain-containing protein [Saprospiraceae bacterium]